MWLIENPWPVVAICVVAALGTVFQWSRNKQGKYLLAAFGCLLLTGMTFLIDEAVVTEPERIALHVRELCFSFQREKTEEARAFFSNSAPELRQLVEQASRMVRVGKDLIVSDIEVKTVGTPPHYTSRFRAKGTVFLKSGASEENYGFQHSQWELLWKQEGGVWRIVKLTRLNPLNQQVMQVFDTSLQ